MRSISWWVCRGSWYCSPFGDNTETLFKREGKNRSGLHPSAVFTEFPARLNIRKGPEYRKPPGGIFLKRRGLHKLGPHQRSALGSGASFHALSITQVTAFKKRPVRRMRGGYKNNRNETGSEKNDKKNRRLFCQWNNLSTLTRQSAGPLPEAPVSARTSQPTEIEQMAN